MVHDDRGPACARGTTHVRTVGEPPAAPPWSLSLPDGAASDVVAREILAVPERSATLVVDTSTIGVRGAEIAVLLAGDGVAYLDAPVSGGVAGAGEDAGGDVRRERRRLPARNPRSPASPIATTGGRPARPGPGDELANNFLSATSLLATSEAIAFGLAEGLGGNHARRLEYRAAAARRRATSSPTTWSRAGMPRGSPTR